MSFQIIVPYLVDSDRDGIANEIDDDDDNDGFSDQDEKASETIQKIGKPTS